MTHWLLLLAALVVGDPADFDHNMAPFQSLRAANPDSVLVHERYQDAVRRNGIEGHLKAMGEEYQLLAAQHPDEVMYRYLAARALIGRATRSAMQLLTAIAEENPEFAPARTAVHEFATVPALPEVSPLLDRAEELFRDGGDPEQVEQIADTAIRVDEWRLQRIRAFDWYSAELKREAMRQMQAEYWRFWELDVRCLRKGGQFQKIEDLLTAMRQRAARAGDAKRLAEVERLRTESLQE
jgi:hypothetical protein